MENATNAHLFEGIWDVLRIQKPEPLDKEDGYRWGLLHIEYLKKELSRLEERALARCDDELLHNIVDSKLRAVEVEKELQGKLNGKK